MAAVSQVKRIEEAMQKIDGTGDAQADATAGGTGADGALDNLSLQEEARGGGERGGGAHADCAAAASAPGTAARGGGDGTTAGAERAVEGPPCAMDVLSVGSMLEGDISIPGMSSSKDDKGAGQTKRERYTLKVLQEERDELGNW